MFLPFFLAQTGRYAAQQDANDPGPVLILRQKIEENPSHPRYIQTVRGLDYRFVV